MIFKGLAVFLTPVFVQAFDVNLGTQEFLVAPKVKIKKFDAKNVTADWNSQALTYPRAMLYNQAALTTAGTLYFKAMDLVALMKERDPKFNLETSLKGCKANPKAQKDVEASEKSVMLLADLDCKDIVVPYLPEHQRIICGEKSQVCRPHISKKLAVASRKAN